MTKHWRNKIVHSIDLGTAKCELSNCFFPLYFQTCQPSRSCISENTCFYWQLQAHDHENYRIFFFSCHNGLFFYSPLSIPRIDSHFICTEQSFLTSFLLFRQMPGLTLLGLLYKDDKHTVEDLTYSFAPNKCSLLAKQIKELTSTAFGSGKNDKVIFKGNNKI